MSKALECAKCGQVQHVDPSVERVWCAVCATVCNCWPSHVACEDEQCNCASTRLARRSHRNRCIDEDEPFNLYAYLGLSRRDF